MALISAIDAAKPSGVNLRGTETETLSLALRSKDMETATVAMNLMDDWNVSVHATSEAITFVPTNTSDANALRVHLRDEDMMSWVSANAIDSAS
jgi:hypothetical protein